MPSKSASWANAATIKKLAELVTATYGWTCWLCGDRIDPALSRRSRYGLTIDHVIARSDGGSDALTNLRPAHNECNSRRQNRPPSVIRPAETNGNWAGFFS
ncbi:HNH endonuclease signature motif containing protein [Boudabousia marimammalium]|uniref:HNH endonuclease n=1 Tax=Boudabousia marimammalium TaxID=156892 RepID=UPI001C9E2CEF